MKWDKPSKDQGEVQTFIEWCVANVPGPELRDAIFGEPLEAVERAGQ